MAIKGLGEVTTLTSGDVTVAIDSHGAKVLSVDVAGRDILFYDENDIGHSGIPLCFPSFGPLNNKEFLYEGTAYPMNQHGFIRDSKFDVKVVGDKTIVCTLSESEESLSRYPFPFLFTVTYEIIDAGLSIRFQFENKSDKTIPLAPGVHPYFNVADVNEVTVTSCALEGEDNEQDCKVLSIADSGVMDEVSREENGVALLKIKNSPDFNLVGHNLDTTLIGTGHENGVVLTSDSSVFNRMTVWRKNETVPYVCVEPAYAQNGINDEPILIEAGKEFDTTVTVAVNR